MFVMKGLLSEVKKENGLALLILFIAIVGFINALRFGVASVDYYSATQALNSWQKDTQIQTKDEFEKAKNAITTATFLHRSNPLYIDLSGQIKEWGAMSGVDPKEGLQNAKLDYLQVTKMRPLWPVTWANLALVKWRLQEFDDEMLAYLFKADKLGPQSTEVHILFSRLGISLHAANNPMYTEIKDIVHSRIRSGLRNSYSRKPIISFIQSSHSLATVCRWMLTKDKHTAEKLLACSS